MQIIGYFFLIVSIIILFLSILMLIDSERTIRNNREELCERIGEKYDDIWWGD